MNDYEYYTIPDFMQDAHFRAWVLDEEPTAVVFWEQWLRSHPNRQADIRRAKELLIGIQEGFNELSETELTNRIQATIGRLANRRDDSITVIRPLRPNPFWAGWAAAAGVALILLGGWYVFIHRPNSEGLPSSYQRIVAQAGPSSREVINPTSLPKQIQLPDGSRVKLAPHSRLSYDPRLATQAQRLVYLTGGAFFAVQRNPVQPFLVYANGVVTKVLGTRFSIRAYEAQSNITVAVQSGRVSVFAPNKQAVGIESKPQSPFGSLVNGIVVTANQQVTYQPTADRLLKTIVEQPVVTHLDKLPTQTVFTDAPVSRIFTQLEQAYSITILYNETDFKDCLLTAKLTNESLQDKIKLICASIGASYEIVDAQIIISGTGCK